MLSRLAAQWLAFRRWGFGVCASYFGTWTLRAFGSVCGSHNLGTWGALGSLRGVLVLMGRAPTSPKLS